MDKNVVIKGLNALIFFLEHEEGDIYPKQYETHKMILEEAIKLIREKP